METLKQIWDGVKAVFLKIGKFFDTIAAGVGWVYRLIMRLRKIFITIPVVYFALKLAMYNDENLPAQVGILLQEDGTYAYTVARDMAIMGPLAVTAACLLLMFCSRRTLYPWLISMFSLVLPILVLVTNIFPS